MCGSRCYNKINEGVLKHYVASLYSKYAVLHIVMPDFLNHVVVTFGCAMDEIEWNKRMCGSRCYNKINEGVLKHYVASLY